MAGFAENDLPGKRFHASGGEGARDVGRPRRSEVRVWENRLPGKQISEELRSEWEDAEVADRIEPDRETDPAEEIMSSIARMLPRWELAAGYRLRAVAERHRLSEHELAVVAELVLRPDPLTGTAIAGVVGLTTGGVARILARLEDRDLVERIEDPGDRRRLLAAPTVEARLMLSDDLVTDDVRYLLRGLDDARLRTVAAVLARLSDETFRQARRVRERTARERRHE